jgi:hypothetical protein
MSKVSNLHGNPLPKIEYMVEQTYGILTADQSSLCELMTDNLFLFPATNRVSNTSARYINCVKCTECVLLI